MNYSETYFELDSEEATHSHPLSPIVTLSVVCMLKDMCQYTLFDVGGVEIHEYKRLKQCQRCQRYSTDFKALNAMLCMLKMSKMVFVAFTQHCIQSTFTHLTHVEDVKDAKCYCTLCTGSLAPPGGKASNVPFTLWV